MRLEYFQMVDRIAELDPEARTVRADCQVPDTSPVFEGHFPGHPLLPGVLMIETMAQTGGWLILAMLRFQRMPFLAQVKEAKLRAFVVPGQALQAQAGFCTTDPAMPWWLAASPPAAGRWPTRRSPIASSPSPTTRCALRCWQPRGESRCRRRSCMTSPRDALITGIGLVSCLGEGIEAHWAALNRAGGFRPVVDATSFAPWSVHPMTPLELDRQIPKRGDQRQMEAWQRIGTYAAGLALDSAGVKGNAELLSRMDMIVAAGGGERDYAVDAAILSALPSAADPDALPERAPADRSAAHAVPGAAVQSAGRQHLDRARRGGLVAHLHGRGGVRRRCRPHRLRPHRRGTGRPVPGRRLVQRAAA